MWICSKTVTKSSFYKHVKIYVNLWAAALYSESKPLPAWKKYPEKKINQQSRTV